MLNCPKCNSEINPEDDKCEVCGAVFNEHAGSKKSKQLLKKKSSSVKTKKIFAVSILSLLVIIAGVVVITSIFGNNGERVAYKLSERIGKSSVQAAQRHADIELDEQSKVAYVNKLNEDDSDGTTKNSFDYIYESTKVIKVDGIHYPKWVVRVKSDGETLDKVSYYDYSVLEKSYKGPKRKDAFDTDVIKVDMKRSAVEDLIKVKPYEIIYNKDSSIEYSYMYYFINENKDEERRAFTVRYNYDNEVIEVI